MNYALLVAPILGFALSCYWAVQAWRRSHATWRTLNERLRPKSWQRWPIHASLWRDFDRHTDRYLWLARLLAPVGAVLFAVSAIAVFAGLQQARTDSW